MFFKKFITVRNRMRRAKFKKIEIKTQLCTFSQFCLILTSILRPVQNFMVLKHSCGVPLSGELFFRFFWRVLPEAFYIHLEHRVGCPNLLEKIKKMKIFC